MRVTCVRILGICLLVLAFFVSFGICKGDIPAGAKPYDIGHQISVKSKVLNEDRPLIIHLPPGYDKSKFRYPVLYVLDGGANFFFSSSVSQYLARNGRTSQMIVVAIRNTNRTRDFTPTATKNAPGAGGAQRFLEFMNKELIPWVDKNYRTQPYRILFGHSLCGMFSIYTMLKTPDLFNAFIAVSPYVMWDDNHLLTYAETVLNKRPSLKKFLYITLGNEPNYTESLGKLTKMFEEEKPEGLEWEFNHMKSEDHMTMPLKSLYDGLEALFSGWRIPLNTFEKGVEAIDEHYRGLSTKFGFSIAVPEYVLNRLGYNYMGKKEFDKAIEILQLNASRFPESANVYDSLGEALERSGRLKNALKNYEIACKHGKKQSDPNLPVYKKNLKRLKDKLDAGK